MQKLIMEKKEVTRNCFLFRILYKYNGSLFFQQHFMYVLRIFFLSCHSYNMQTDRTDTIMEQNVILCVTMYTSPSELLSL